MVGGACSAEAGRALVGGPMGAQISEHSVRTIRFIARFTVLVLGEVTRLGATPPPGFTVALVLTW